MVYFLFFICELACLLYFVQDKMQLRCCDQPKSLCPAFAKTFVWGGIRGGRRNHMLGRHYIGGEEVRKVSARQSFQLNVIGKSLSIPSYFFKPSNVKEFTARTRCI